jgi:hypothetical protein
MTQGEPPPQVTPPSLPPLRDLPPAGGAQPIGTDTEAWAKLARNFAWFILWMIAALIAAPYVIFTFGIQNWPEADRAKAVVEWSHAVLPPVVGFVSAVVGYFFGARTTGRQPDP